MRLLDRQEEALDPAVIVTLARPPCSATCRVRASARCTASSARRRPLRLPDVPSCCGAAPGLAAGAPSSRTSAACRALLAAREAIEVERVASVRHNERLPRLVANARRGSKAPLTTAADDPLLGALHARYPAHHPARRGGRGRKEHHRHRVRWATSSSSTAASRSPSRRCSASTSSSPTSRTSRRTATACARSCSPTGTRITPARSRTCCPAFRATPIYATAAHHGPRHRQAARSTSCSR